MSLVPFEVHVLSKLCSHSWNLSIKVLVGVGYFSKLWVGCFA